MTATTSPHDDLLENARFLHAYLECSNAIQDGVKAMLRIAFDKDTTPQEKNMALNTIADALFPNPHKGLLGMDLEESETDAAQGYPEMAEIVRDMNAEEDAFSVRLRDLMDLRGITQAELAARIGVGQPAISNMLNRQCRPQTRTILKLAEALSTTALTCSPTASW